MLSEKKGFFFTMVFEWTEVNGRVSNGLNFPGIIILRQDI